LGLEQQHEELCSNTPRGIIGPCPQKISSKSVDNFLSNLVDKQTGKNVLLSVEVVSKEKNQKESL